MFPEVFTTYEDIAKLQDQVSLLYEKLGINIPQGSDLRKMMKLCSGIDGKVENLSEVELLDVIRAKRILEAILSCSNENEVKEPARSKIKCNT